jgi:MoxR-like ATPase
VTRADLVPVVRGARDAVCGVLRGKEAVVDLVMVAVVAGGHVLLQDVPGVGKTTLASAVARAIGGQFARIQFTSDLLPGDITGVLVLDASAKDGLRFRPGPIFANVVMADEINRTSPKTQSALFEAMEEGAVTVDGRTMRLPSPFTVVATQNPFDLHGTFPLPDSQLDRFLVRLELGYADRESERAILRRAAPRAILDGPVMAPEQLASAIESASTVRIPDEVEDYLLTLVERTRRDARLLRGVSTRGALALARAVRARAWIAGRAFVVPEDVRALAVPVLGHRVVARADGGPAGRGGSRAIAGLLDELPWAG